MDPNLPPRPTLRPGVRVVRRDAQRLQVGTQPGARLVLPDSPEVRALLDALLSTRQPVLPDRRHEDWMQRLWAAGLVVDADRLRADLAGPVPRAAVAAAYAQAGPQAHDRLDCRVRATVDLVAPAPWREHVTELANAAGIRTAAERGSLAQHPTPDVVLVVEPGGELARPALDEWMRESRPHLTVRNLAGRVEVGPLVAPGLTACLRCVDAHRADLDPGHGLVVEQHAPRPEEPCDPLLMRLALALAVRDVVTFLEGERPRTWSATVAVEESLRLDQREWTRHPRCGCSWQEVFLAG